MKGPCPYFTVITVVSSKINSRAFSTLLNTQFQPIYVTAIIVSFLCKWQEEIFAPEKLITGSTTKSITNERKIPTRAKDKKHAFKVCKKCIYKECRCNYKKLKNFVNNILLE